MSVGRRRASSSSSRACRAAAHDASDGGIACALAECAIAGGVGAVVDLDGLVELRGAAGEACLFGEGPGGFVVAGRRGSISALVEESGGVDAIMIGQAGGDRIEISAAEAALSVPVADAERAWRSLAERLEGAAAAA